MGTASPRHSHKSKANATESVLVNRLTAMQLASPFRALRLTPRTLPQPDERLPSPAGSAHAAYSRCPSLVSRHSQPLQDNTCVCPTNPDSRFPSSRAGGYRPTRAPSAKLPYRRCRSSLDLLLRDAGRQLRHTKAALGHLEHPEIGDNEIDDADAGQRQRAFGQDL